MAEKKNIYETISEVMKKLGAVKKGSYNNAQKYRYRGIDDLMNALAPVLAREKLFVVPEVLEHHREERVSLQNKALISSVCKIRYTFYAEDGSHVEAVVIGEGMDSGDKASNKAMAAAFKYACFQVFCIPTEESEKKEGMVDPDAESPEVKPRPQEGKRPSKDDPITPQMVKELRETFQNNGIDEKKVAAAWKVDHLEALTLGQRQAILKNIKKFKEECGIEQVDSDGEINQGSGDPVQPGSQSDGSSQIQPGGRPAV